MTNLLDYTICSALDFPIFNEIVNKSQIPYNCFGAFVSVKRGQNQQLNEWPIDIHGCIGDWEKNNYKNLKKNKIVAIIKKVSYQATNNDSRNKYFKTIYKDSYTKFEVNLMLTPVYEIDSNTGIFKKKNRESFNNNEYGIIVSGSSTATYLPKVFEKEDWYTIKNKLNDKSRSRNENNKFYGYKAKIISKQIYKIFNQKYLNNYFINFLKFINEKYEKFVPYEYINNNIYTDRNQYVRNIATIYDILNFNNKFKILNIKILNNIYRDLEYYVKLFEKPKYKNEMRQASSFLILALNIINKDKYKYLINSITKYLYENVNHLEENFELCEVLIGLNETNPKNKFLLKQQNKMYKKLQKEKDGDNIFKYNWQSKFLYSLSRKNIDENINNHRKLLLKKIIKIITEFTDETETNYLAVSLEALSSLLKINRINKQKIMDNILYLFSKLNKRYDMQSGLYKFKSGSSRLDITGHILNGLILF